MIGMADERRRETLMKNPLDNIGAWDAFAATAESSVAVTAGAAFPAGADDLSIAATTEAA